MQFATVMAALTLVVAQAQPPAETTKRYGIEADLELFPQSNAKEALASVLKAIDRGRIDYLLAQLADPQFVDQRVRESGGKFDEVVKDTSRKFSEDPTAVKEMQRILREGEWQEGETSASAHLKDKETTVFLKKLGQRWYLENRKKGEPASKP
jgi:hypothetical protein